MTPIIIHEDSSLFVVGKPSGWITNSASTTGSQPVLQDWIAKNFEYYLRGNREMRDGVVHRLDKETSGVLLVAKTQEAFEKLQSEFKNREVEKTYTALVHGSIEKNGRVEATVGRLPWRRDRFGILPGGRDSITDYKVLKYYKDKNGEEYTLAEFHPKTGRTHQIRIHAKHIGHPIVADQFYAGRKTARNDRKWCPRLFLHASGIIFIHPKTGKRVEFTSDLPDDLQKVLQNLSQSSLHRD